jgi:hypothetical protein
MMRTSPVSAAAGLFVVYAAALLANAALYTWWSGDRGGWGRLAVRVVGIVAIAWGLGRRRRWAWWFGVLAGGWLGVFGLLALVAASTGGIFAARPYPAADYAFLVVSVAALLGAVALLLIPRSRAELPPRSS